MGDSARAESADEIYVDFDSFLKSAIHQYYQSGGKGRRANFIALVIASGEIASMALDSVRSGAGTKKLAVGAAGILALRIGLRFLVGGPLGIVLAGATAASLVAYFVRNRAQITEKIGRYRELVASIRVDYEKTQSDFRDGRFDRDQRNLMIDGLMKRFMERVNDDS